MRTGIDIPNPFPHAMYISPVIALEGAHVGVGGNVGDHARPDPISGQEGRISCSKQLIASMND